MKAVVLKEKNRIVVEDVPGIKLEADQVCIRVKACGICGSDIRYLSGENPWAMHTLGITMVNKGNLILGHEFAGDIAEVFNKKDEYLIGKRVVAIPFNTCGQCEFCRSGRYHLCQSTIHIGHGAGWDNMEYYPGGMAEYCQVWKTHVCELPKSVSYEDAVIIDPLSVAIHAIKLSAVQPMNNIMVIGTGSVGLCIIQAARAFGVDQVYCTDILDSALVVAETVGSDVTINADPVDVLNKIRSLTDGKGVNAVFDTVGTLDSQKLGLKALAASGSLVNLVANKVRASYQLIDLYGERRIICSANSKYDDYLLGIKLMENGIVKAGPLITHRFPIDEAPKAFNLLLHKEKSGAIKIVIEPDGN